MRETLGRGLERHRRTSVPADQADRLLTRQPLEALVVELTGVVDVVSPADTLVPPRAETVDRVLVEAQLVDEAEPVLLCAVREVERDASVQCSVPRVDEPLARSDVRAAPPVASGGWADALEQFTEFKTVLVDVR